MWFTCGLRIVRFRVFFRFAVEGVGALGLPGSGFTDAGFGGCQRFRVLGFKVEGFGFIIMWFITFGFRVFRLRVLGLIGFITRCRVSSVGFASVSTLWLPMQFASESSRVCGIFGTTAAATAAVHWPYDSSVLWTG